MEIINYALSSVIVVSALFAGQFLAWIAQEELLVSKKYLQLAQSVLFSLVVFFLFYFYKINALIFALLAFVLFLGLYKTKVLNKDKSTYVVYVIFAVLFFLSAMKGPLILSASNSLLAVSSLIFLYGLVESSLLYKDKRKWKIMTISAVLFLIIANGLFFV